MPLSASSLLSSGLFGDLEASLRAQIAEQCVGYSYATGETVLCCADQGQDVYFILAGAVQVTNFMAAGKQVTFRDLGPGDMFGLLSAIDGQPRSAFVVARDPVNIARMSACDFKSLIARDGRINERVLCHLAGLVRALTERVNEYGSMSVRQRLYAELLRLACSDAAVADHGRISPAPTHADLATRIATHREAVTRELRQLSRQGIVSKQCGELVIRDLPQLRQLLQPAG
ncbi:MAG: Crp/Fnr family transcriptional regulator [Chromatocurvus sp.]